MGDEQNQPNGPWSRTKPLFLFGPVTFFLRLGKFLLIHKCWEMLEVFSSPYNASAGCPVLFSTIFAFVLPVSSHQPHLNVTHKHICCILPLKTKYGVTLHANRVTQSYVKFK